MDEPKKTKAAVYAAIWDGPKLLVLGRKKWLSEGTPWIMPGGGVEGNEDYRETAVREVEEEIGINITDSDELKFYKSYKTEWTDNLTVYECEELGGWYIEQHGMLDTEKFFGRMWLDTSDKQMIKLFWYQFMPGLRMYLTDKLDIL